MDTNETETTQTTETITPQADSSAEIRKSEPTAKESQGENERTKHRSIRANLKSHLKGAIEVKPKVELQQATRVPTAPERPVNATTPEVAPILSPADMRADEKEAFSKLSPEMQSYVSRRAYDLRRQITEAQQRGAGMEKELSSILNVVSPVRDEYARLGLSPEQIVQSAIAWDKAFRTDRIAAAKEYLDSWGVDPTELLQSGVSPGYAQQPSPQKPEINVDTLREELRKEFQDELRMREQAESTKLDAFVVQKFIESKPLFKDPGTAEQLEMAMAPIVYGLRQSNPSIPAHELLETAYGLLVKGNPQFSGLNQQLEAKAEAEKAKADAQKAMQASRSISGGPGSGTPTRKIKDLRENLRLRMQGAL
jgi:hypothetical protein